MDDEEFIERAMRHVDIGRYDLLSMDDGTLLTTHGPQACLGPNCCIHNPSDHPLREAPLVWLDVAKAMYRRCAHNHIHPDPDSFDFVRMLALHGRRDPLPYWHPCCDERCCEARS